MFQISNISKYFYDKKGDSKLDILSSPLFFGVLIIKIISSFFFASNYLVDYVAKFVNYYFISGFQNPYEFFYKLGELQIFPYSRVMLWILSIPRIIFAPLLSTNYNLVSNLEIFIYRIPILLADIIIFIILSRWLKTKKDKVLIYYWCSPILFYINYIDGQLDVIPIMLLFVSLYLL
ncbi:MAG: hypothetical protein Q8L47_04815, partial [bacterium]|nr:hypothetical protein [bacterium]